MPPISKLIHPVQAASKPNERTKGQRILPRLIPCYTPKLEDHDVLQDKGSIDNVQGGNDDRHPFEEVTPF